MRGEYDAILPWPFRQKATLMLLDQDRSSHVVMPFQPKQNSQRPRNEMNVASCCPLLLTTRILSNSSYVKDDALFIKCIIEGSD